MIIGNLIIRGVLAQDYGGSEPSGITNPLKFDTLEQVLKAIADFLFTISIPISVIVIIVGAFQLLTAGGNEEKIRKGKRTITWAVIGFAVILVSGSIALLIQNLLQ